jgi:DNA-binding transcriptional ArsR family regulator
MNNIDEFFAISDPSRRFLLEEIRRAPKAVNELAAGLAISRPAVSQHLRALRDCGLVTVTSIGTKRIYAVNSTGFAKVNQWLDQFWLKSVDAETDDMAPTLGGLHGTP